MCIYRLRLALIALALFCAAPATASTYYVSAAGDDAAAGTAAAPWRTLSRINALTLRPGDSVLLRGGDTFAGGLFFDGNDAGTPASPVVLTSYGTGRATIASGTAAGIYVYNAAGYRISNLKVAGSGGAASGVTFFTDLSGGVKLPYVRIDSVEISGFGRDGIEVGGWNATSGYSDVQIVNAVAHDNARTGIFVYAQQPNVHQSVAILASRAFNNPGIAGTGTNSGSGIILSGVNGGRIERSVAHSNGWNCDAAGGPVGIWTYDSTAVGIRHNESYANRTGGAADGGGFDLDQNVSMSTVEYNYSHDNDGAGYLLAHAPATTAHFGNVVRYNISQNDGRRNSYAAIEVWGRIRSTEIYNNTVFVSPAPSGTPRAVRIGNAGISDRDAAGLHVRNNVFQTTAALPLIEVTSGQLAGATDLRFEGNDYFSSGAPFTILYGSTTYSSLSGWRATGQEMNGSTAVGRSVDPLLAAPGAGPTFDDATRLETLDAYHLRSDSPLLDAGLNLTTLFGIDPGGYDFYATPLDAPTDVGAYERPQGIVTANDAVMTASNASSIVGAWQRTADSTAAGGFRLQNPDAGAAKLLVPMSSPTSYFELTFSAVAGRAYRLWIRGRSAANAPVNDSVYVQFSDSVDSGGSALWRIGTSTATTINLEDCSGCGLAGWGWQDNGYGAGVLGPLVYFAHTGSHTIRIQPREDGLSIDQIVLSSMAYLNVSPGALRNDTTILPAPPSSPTTTSDLVIYASDVAASAIHGDWSRVSDASAANALALFNPDRGAAKVASALAAPSSYVDVSFEAEQGVPYHLWLRLRASGNGGSNDSVYVQFSGAVDAGGASLYRIGTTSGASVILQDYLGQPISGWGWNDNGWGSFGESIFFAATGRQTLRLQPREDGVYIDQLVISSSRYLTASPGTLTNDKTVVPR